jgi:hypothetical protein
MTIQARDASKLKAEQTVYGWQFEQMSCNPAAETHAEVKQERTIH